MTLQSFQRAICDFAASPELCLAVRDNPESALRHYDLTEREYRRLIDVVWQPGMSTNCTIYRSNRITPIWTLLNSTCFLLGDEVLTREVNLFWQNGENMDVQYVPEINRFGAFLKQRIRSGAITNSFIEEILDFELAINSLQFCSRRQIIRELESQTTVDYTGLARLHPLARVIKFKHDPVLLLQYMADKILPPSILEEMESFVLASVIEGSLQIKQLISDTGIKLFALQTSDSQLVAPKDIMQLAAVGLVVFQKQRCGEEEISR